MFEDIIGADDIIGANVAFGGYNELDALFAGAYPRLMVGADPAALAGQPPAALQALERNLAARHAAMVVPRQATKAREYPLGFPTTSIATTVTTTVQAQPQVPFRGRRLIIPSDIAGSVLINDLKVGKNSMFPASNPVPGRAFTELGVGVDLNLDTAQISQIVSLNVTNTSGGTISFNAAIIGTAVE